MVWFIKKIKIETITCKNTIETITCKNTKRALSNRNANKTTVFLTRSKHVFIVGHYY